MVSEVIGDLDSTRSVVKDIKKELIKNREESICEYSGLPSPKFYESLQKK